MLILIWVVYIYVHAPVHLPLVSTVLTTCLHLSKVLFLKTKTLARSPGFVLRVNLVSCLLAITIDDNLEQHRMQNKALWLRYERPPSEGDNP